MEGSIPTTLTIRVKGDAWSLWNISRVTLSENIFLELVADGPIVLGSRLSIVGRKHSILETRAAPSINAGNVFLTAYVDAHAISTLSWSSAEANQPQNSATLPTSKVLQRRHEFRFHNLSTLLEWSLEAHISHGQLCHLRARSTHNEYDRQAWTAPEPRCEGCKGNLPHEPGASKFLITFSSCAAYTPWFWVQIQIQLLKYQPWPAIFLRHESISGQKASCALNILIVLLQHQWLEVRQIPEFDYYLCERQVGISH